MMSITYIIPRLNNIMGFTMMVYVCPRLHATLKEKWSNKKYIPPKQCGNCGSKDLTFCPELPEE